MDCYEIFVVVAFPWSSFHTNTIPYYTFGVVTIDNVFIYLQDMFILSLETCFNSTLPPIGNSHSFGEIGQYWFLFKSGDVSVFAVVSVCLALCNIG